MKGGPQTWDEFVKKPVKVTRACISLDGTRIAAVFRDGTIRVYDTTTGEVMHPPFKVDSSWSVPVIFSRDGKLAASGASGKVFRLWNVQTGEEVESFDILVYSLAFSPDGTCIAAGCEGRNYQEDSDLDGRGSYNIRVINLELAKASYFHPHMFIPSGGEGIKLLKGEVPPSPFEGHGDYVNSITYSSDGKQIASTSVGRIVRVWDVSTGEGRTFPAGSGLTWSVAFSPDGTKLFSNTTLVDLSTGSCTSPGAFCETKVRSIAFSADGRFLALGSSGAAIQIWDASTYQMIAQLVGHGGQVNSVDFFPDGKQIISASNDGTIRVWDIELLEERRGIDGWRIGMDWDSEFGFFVRGPKEEYLFWIPLPFRHTRNTLVIGRCLTIDFSNFVHGDQWVKCREPL